MTGIACLDCRAFYLAEHDNLIAACASVGIEHGLTTGQTLQGYLDGYHESGHHPDYPNDDTAT